MKAVFRSVVYTLFLTVCPFSVLGQIMTKSLVKGNCGMCQYRIESTALSVKGVDTAVWSPYSDTLTVWCNEEADHESIIIAVHKKIAEHGHDNQYYQAPDTVYSHLPECCLYKRMKYSKFICSEHRYIDGKKRDMCSKCGKALVRRKSIR